MGCGGALFEATVDRDKATLMLRTLKEPSYLEPALRAFNAMLVHPTFPSLALRREKNRLVQELQYQQQFPGHIAARAFFSALYDHGPYGDPVLGQVSTLAKIEKRDVENFYRRYYTANNAVLAIVGDLDSQEAHSLAEKILSDLPKGPLPESLQLSPASAIQQQEIQFLPSKPTFLLHDWHSAYRSTVLSIGSRKLYFGRKCS